MFLRSIITGSVITAILIVVLSSSRLFQTEVAENDAILTEVETVYLDPPPEPEMEELEEEELELEPLEIQAASIPALELMVSDLEMPALPETQAKFDPKLANVSIEMPELDRAPADLPVRPKPVAKPKAKPAYKATPKPAIKPSPKPKPKPKPQPRPKEYYGAGELDRLPREIRVGRFSWPSRAKGVNGIVKFLLEIDTSGRVSVVSVLSSTDSELTIAAKRVATGSRFTAPTKSGKAVKARFTKTYRLKKPR